MVIGIGFAILLAILVPVPGIASHPAAGEQATPSPTPTTVPFLQPPFARAYRVTSYFDHHFPDHRWDDTIVILNGERASAIDGISDRTPTFRGGYWLPETRRYVYYDGHNAFDYGTGAGTTILAAAPGEVVFAGSVPSGCDTPLQYVYLKHANGYRTSYLHLEGISVRQGEWVEAGDPLGISGNSGCSLGPHLHFVVVHNSKFTDPYGWQPADVPDPLIEYSGESATWLWAPDEPPLPVGRLTHPSPGTKTNGDLSLSFVPDQDSPPIARVEFVAFHQERWHPLGADDDESDGWSLTWDTRAVPEGEVWLHAWAVGVDGRVGKGSPILTDITVDRHPPQGFIVGLLPESAVGAHLWLYAASHDPESTTRQVTFLIREAAEGQWREIGDAEWLHTSNWLLEWDVSATGDDDPLADGSQFDLMARLTDGAGNTTWTQPVEGLVLDRGMPGGDLVSPQSGTPFTTTLDLVLVPFPAGRFASGAIDHVAFYVWHDGAWHAAGVDRDGADGWAVSWDPAYVADQARLRVQARVYDGGGRVNTALPQVTALTLDRTPPSAGYIRPAMGGVARPDVDQRVWAWDGGSGVDYVEFFVNQEAGWLKIGEDRSEEGGWSLLWDARGVPDGILDFSARVYDRAGNEEWTTDVCGVALDRAPPVGKFALPLPGMYLDAPITLTLDVTDTVSGLDRAIFYARYEGHWHHLGADTEHEDGFSLAWDATAVGDSGDVTLTAWVYDRAGNHRELPHVEGLVLGHPRLSAEPHSPVASPTPSPTAWSPTALAPTAFSVPTASPVSQAMPTEAAKPLPPTVSPAVSPTPVATSAQQPTPAATWPSPATSALSPTPVPIVPPSPPAPEPVVPPAFWYLIAGGWLVALVLLVRSIRDLASSRR